jgi:hypothetical protein
MQGCMVRIVSYGSACLTLRMYCFSVIVPIICM